MGFINNIVIEFKKRFAYESDAEQVDIRLESLPDWLYKITVKYHGNLSTACEKHYVDIQNSVKKLGIAMDALHVHQILDVSVSPYKKDSYDKAKVQYVTLIQNFIKVLEPMPDSIESYRAYFSVVGEALTETRTKALRYSKAIVEFAPKDIARADTAFESISTVLLAFSDTFASSSNNKVAKIVELSSDIENALQRKEDLEKDVGAVTVEVQKAREHVYKLNDRITSLRNSARFKDVLKKETKLGRLLEDKEALLKPGKSHLKRIYEELYTIAKKPAFGELDLAREYVNHLDYALVHDTTFDIGPLLLEVQKKADEKNPSQASVAWLLSNLKEMQGALVALNRKINMNHQGLNTHVVLNDLQDNESRIVYYQDQLKHHIATRRTYRAKIVALKITERQDRLHKDLLILTGYDVNVVY
jgi:outer membrane murein-binding lipoprotein Lpp